MRGLVVGLLKLLLSRGLNIGLLIDGIELATLDGVKEDIGSLLDTLEELIIVDTTLGSLLIGVVLEDLLAVGFLDLVLSGPPSVQQPNGIKTATYLPVLSLTLEHHGILVLALVADITIFDVLGALLSLDAVILRECALVAGSSGVGKEVRSNRLDASLSSLRKLADGLEVLISSPTAGKSGKGEESPNLEMANVPALNAYRHLMRAARIAFQGDAPILSAAQLQIRNEFRQKASIDASTAPAAIKHAEDVAKVLRQNVIQGQKLEDDDNTYKLRIHEDIERGDNESIKTAGKGMAQGGCCGGKK
ncbi:hypothetical protein HG530_001811 [Fusarium avenaceum]|nr:hypothetical protein HG530_001811 [Fusarium avenaceum]